MPLRHSLNNSAEPDFLSGLSEAEKASYLKCNPNSRMAKASGLRSEDAEKVSKVKYDEDIAALKKEIADQREKLEEAKVQKDQIRIERDSFRDRFDAKRIELANLQKETDELRKELHDTKDELAELRKKPKSAPVSDVTEINSLKKENRKLEREKEELAETMAGTESELEAAKGRIEELESANQELSESLSTADSRLAELEGPVIPEFRSAGTIAHSSPTTLTSDLFDAHRYSVRISRDMSYIKFRPDAEGQVFCEDGTMSIPSLPDYIQYTEGRTFEAASIDDTLMVKLR